MHKLVLFFLLIFLLNEAFAQDSKKEITPEMKQAVITYNSKINELTKKYDSLNFVVEREGRLKIKSGVESVVNILLQKGSWYNICYVADPLSSKVKTILFLDGQGELVEDRNNVDDDARYWSDFSFMCYETGYYELTFFQKNKIEYPLSYFMIYRKSK